MGQIRAVLYCRVACDEQVLKAQEAMLLQYAGGNGYDVRAVLSDIDSGADMSRPSLRRIEELAANGEVDMALAAKCSRITRDSEALLDFVERLARSGVELRTALDCMSTERLRTLRQIRGFIQEAASAGVVAGN